MNVFALVQIDKAKWHIEGINNFNIEKNNNGNNQNGE